MMRALASHDATHDAAHGSYTRWFHLTAQPREHDVPMQRRLLTVDNEIRQTSALFVYALHTQHV